MTADHPTREERYALNTDRELYREPKGDLPSDYYAASVHVTQDGRIGMNVGGTVFELPIRDWHAHVAAALVAADPAPAQPDAALSDESRVRHALLSALLDEYGADEETWMAMGSLRRVTRAVLLAARAAQPEDGA